MHVAPAVQELARLLVALSVARRVSDLQISGAVTFRPFTKGFLN